MKFARRAACVAAAFLPLGHLGEIAVSDPSSTGTEDAGVPKKKVSPARNLVGIVGLIALIAVAGLQYSAVFGHNAAVNALEARSQDDDKALLTVAEVESLIGKSPDGPGTEFQDGPRTFTKTTYTWRGALKSFTLTAFYTRGVDPRLHHFESDGSKYAPDPVMGGLGTMAVESRKGRSKKAAPPADEPAKAVAPADAPKTPAPAADAPKSATTPPADVKAP